MQSQTQTMTFGNYDTERIHDELFHENGTPRNGARLLIEQLNSMSIDEVIHRQQAMDRALMQMGITFTVYGAEEGTEKIFPFDLVPRVVEAFEWGHIEAGLKQRIQVLNRFIHDIYHEQGDH